MREKSIVFFLSSIHGLTVNAPRNISFPYLPE
jgi:hypothetical protein